MVASTDTERMRSRLFRNLPAVELPDLPKPRIEVLMFWDTPFGFVPKEAVAYGVQAVGLNGVVVASNKFSSKEGSDSYVDDLVKSLGWSVVRVRRVVETRFVYELYEEESSNDQ